VVAMGGGWACESHKKLPRGTTTNAPLCSYCGGILPREVTPAPKPRKRRKKSPRQIIRKALLKQRASLRRKARPKVHKVSKRFAKKRNPEFLAWIRQLLCAVPHCQIGLIMRDRIEAAHIVTRGAGGEDVGNVIPLCQTHHRQQHREGIQTFARFYWNSLDALKSRAASYGEQYLKQRELGWGAGVSSPEDK